MAAHVLVTGASTGIGRATALALRDHGMVVHGSVRNDTDAAALERDGVRPVLFDVVDDDAVTAGIEQVRAAAGRELRGVVANAGIAVNGPLENVSTEELRRSLDVNVLGVHRTVQPLIGDLIDNGGRVVLMSSIAGKVGMPFFGPYNASKFAVEGYGDALRRELAPHGVHVAIIEPGAIATPIWERSTPSEERWEEVHPRYVAMGRALAENVVAEGARAPGPEVVARAVLHALVSRRPRDRYAMPLEARLQTEVLPRLPSRVQDTLVKLNLRRYT